MIIKNPLPFDAWPNSHFEDLQNVDTSPELPSINKRNKVFLQDLQPLPQEAWTPPPYWKNLLYMEESKFEQECKKWFFRTITIAMLLYVLAIASIFLFKLLILVINLK